MSWGELDALGIPRPKIMPPRPAHLHRDFDLKLRGLSEVVPELLEKRPERGLTQLTYPKPLIIEEIGYFPRSREAASLFFRCVAGNCSEGD